MTKKQRDAITAKIEKERQDLIRKALSGAPLTEIEQHKVDCIISVRRNMINQGLIH